MNIHPLRDIVVIKADKPAEKTKSGLYLTEQWKTLPPTGEVIAVGPLVTTVAVGERVVFDRYATVMLEGDIRLAKESHIFGGVDAEI